MVPMARHLLSLLSGWRDAPNNSHRGSGWPDVVGDPFSGGSRKMRLVLLVVVPGVGHIVLVRNCHGVVADA